MLNRFVIALTRKLPKYLVSQLEKSKEDPVELAMKVGSITGAFIGSTVGATSEAEQAYREKSSTATIIKKGFQGGIVGGAIGGVVGYGTPALMGLGIYASLAIVEAHPTASTAIAVGTTSGLLAAKAISRKTQSPNKYDTDENENLVNKKSYKTR